METRVTRPARNLPSRDDQVSDACQFDGWRLGPLSSARPRVVLATTQQEDGLLTE
jgi:hypothetical protein